MAARVLEAAAGHGYSPEAAILIQPALAAYWAFGFPTRLTAADAPRTRILTVNGTDSPVGGMIPGALDIETSGCGHCTNQSLAWFVMWAATSGGDDQLTHDAAASFGIDARVYELPSAVPLPLPPY